MLASFSEESRLQVITEALLKHGDKWVRGRYRMPAEQEEQRETALKYKYRERDDGKDTRGKPLVLEDTFRSKHYKEAAKQALYQEFKGLSHSTIRAVLAEFNWSYTGEAYPPRIVEQELEVEHHKLPHAPKSAVCEGSPDGAMDSCRCPDGTSANTATCQDQG
jgi:hypothetical protein